MSLVVAAMFSAAAYAQEGTNYVALKRIAQEASARAFREKAAAEAMVMRQGEPVRIVDRANQRVVEVMKLDENGMPVYYTTFNKGAALTTRANRVYPGGGAGLNLTGSGVVMGIWDGGTVRATHQEFATGRVTNLNGTPVNFHATHVAGTMIASGIGNPFGITNGARGMSYQGTLRAYDWTSDTAEVAAEVAMANPISISNHSYGPIAGWDGEDGDWAWYGWTGYSNTQDYMFGSYSAACRNFDDIAYNAPFYLSVWAAGNDRGEGPTNQPVDHWVRNSSGSWITSNAIRDLDGGLTGYDTISGTGCAKNVLTVGAVGEVASYTGPSSVAMSSFSGFGPTDDGRIKPDIVGKGVGVISPMELSNTDYGGMSGTSMASPNIAGSLGLLQQHHQTVAGYPMRSSTMRALVIHTADEAGATTGPDYRFGWGLMNTEAAAAIISSMPTNPGAIRLPLLNNGSTLTYQFYSDGTKPLKATLAWTDPAGTASTGLNPATLRLVNDVDMRITRGASTVYPWTLNPSNPSAAAVNWQDNFRDNVEQILIPTTTAGWYTLTINHKGTLSGGSQRLSLIVTGDVANAVRLTSFTVSKGWMTWSDTSVGTVRIDRPAPAGGITIPLTKTAGLNAPASVTIPAGTLQQTFNITAASPVSGQTNGMVSINSYNGETVNRPVNLLPLYMTSATLNDNTLSPGQTATLTINLNGPAPAGGFNFTMSRSPTYWVIAPENFTVPAGQTSTTVNVQMRAGAPSGMSCRVTPDHTYPNGNHWYIRVPFTSVP